MYKVLLAIESEDVLNEIAALHVWGEPTEFEIAAVVRDGDSAYAELKNCKYDLLIAENAISGMEAFSLIRRVKAEGLCTHVVPCSRHEDFQAARQGIILGAYDYFVKPFDPNLFISLFSRIKNETHGSRAAEIYYIDEIADYFENHDLAIKEHLENLTANIYSTNNDLYSANELFAQIVNGVVAEIFERFDWLDLFLSEEDFRAEDYVGTMTQDGYVQQQKQKLLELFGEYCELYPPHNVKIHDVILYILNHPESDLRQKTLSDELYINSSYLSTMFTAQTDIRFVDYITRIKLMRAAWLLTNTGMKITEIAGRLDYKDIGYFSRQFKKKFGITPSEYRIPENYNFEI